MKKIITLLLLAFLLVGTSANAATLYLVSNTGTGWSGQTSGNTGFATVAPVNLSSPLQSLNAWYAATTFASGDNVWVLSDATPYTLTAAIAIKTYGKMYGGFAGNETSLSGRSKGSDPWIFNSPTVIDGANSYQGFTGGTSTMVIDGLTVQNCKYTGSTAGSAAGISCGTSTTIQNCIITGCLNSGTASGGAGGAVSLASGAKILNSYVHDNTYSGTGGYGGGAVSVIGHATYKTTQTDAISGCKITSNTATTGNGGGIYVYSATVDGLDNLGIKNSIISNNTASASGAAGGGIYVIYYNVANAASTTPLVISGCTISSNSCTGSGGGGGLYIKNNTATQTTNNVTIQNCTILSNSAASGATSYSGGAVWSSTNVTMNNCVVASNVGGSSLYWSNVASVIATVQNCTFANNINATPAAVAAFYSNAPVTASVFTNSIFYNQTATPVTYGGGTAPSVTYCGLESTVNLSNAPYNGTGNIGTIASGSFVNSTSDYHLVAGSVAAEAGTTIAAYSSDLDNVARPQLTGLNFCMGAYELPQSKFYFRSNASANWSTASTWQASPKTTWLTATTVPAATAASVTIRNGNTVTADANISTSSLTVDGGGQLTLNNGKTLNASSLTIQADTAKAGTFVDSNTTGGLTVSGTTAVQQWLSTGRNWYISSPASNATSAVVNPAGNSNKLYWYDEAHGSTLPWRQITTNDSILRPMKGYIVNMGADGTLNFSGTLNTGEKTITVYRTTGQTKEGFNLIGNPYPSYVNWESATKTNIGSTIWYRTKTKAGAYTFDTYNATSHEGTNTNGIAAVTNLIPPMQTVWVRVADGQTSGSVTFNNGMRSHKTGAATALKVSANRDEVQQSVHIALTNRLNTDETILVFHPEASNELDAYDSEKMSNNNSSIPELFTRTENSMLVINGMSQIPLDKEIPLGFTTLSSGDFTIAASVIKNIPADIQLYLNDHSTGEQTNLTTDTYTFNSDISTANESRFSLLFKAPGVTTTTQNPANEQISVFVNALNEIIILTKENCKYAIYNTVGQLIQNGVTNYKLTTNNYRLNSGVYIVKVNNQSTRVVAP